jgi:ectoine hydroxylase-related dioxygenase (phytanoyl-CoA dioxygenase family)
MDDRERYLFDLQGYLAIEGALSADEVAELDGLFEERVQAEVPADADTFRFGYPTAWSPAVRRLVDHDRIRPYLEGILGPDYRLDHDYADLIRRGRGPIGCFLHGGGTPYSPIEYYDFRDGEPRSGLAVAAINLRDVGPEDGGFAAVPGSHKANYALPEEWKDLERMQPFVRRVTGPAGTVVVFTEALSHGTLPWTGAGERRTIFLKFSPYPLSWHATYYDASRYPELTDRQKLIFEAPNARYGRRYEQ